MLRRPPIHVLVIDPQRALRTSLESPLRARGYKISFARTESSAIELAERELPNLVFKSYVPAAQEKRTGLMERLRSACPDSQFIFMSDSANVQMAMQAVRRGAFDCLPLPCEPDQLLDSVERALRRQKLIAENHEILRRLQDSNQPNILAGTSRSMHEIQNLVERIADTDVTVLIEGESGTGKELVARRIHDLSERRDGPFVAVNCAALADSILESELFGHVRGAFTGAIHDKPGRFALAKEGTLFLDEIGDLSLLGQADLLRVLEDGIYRPLGSRTTVRADARIVAATNRNLEERCRLGQFRDDLLYRLNVVTLSIPPLRERPEDIPGLAAMFLQHFCVKHRRPSKTISPFLQSALCAFPWPGNVRQLRNVVERMVLVAPARVLGSEHIPPHLSNSKTLPASLPFRPGMKLADMEMQLIRATLEACGGNRTETATQLGISRRALYYKIARYHLG